MYVEVRDEAAYVHAPAEPGAGGLPIGHGRPGRDACCPAASTRPVAGYMIAKRGVELEAIHFFSYPYTSRAGQGEGA